MITALNYRIFITKLFTTAIAFTAFIGLQGFTNTAFGSTAEHPISEHAMPFNTYVYWQGEASEARKPFESELMRLIFRLSEEKYGLARLEISQWKISSKRSIQLMREGERLHIQNAPFLLQELDKEAIVALPVPILNNLLGYRQLIIRKSDLHTFAKINDFASFLKLEAGQGRGWADLLVYRENGIPVLEAPSFDGMFPMLLGKRFDYIPLGISEAFETLQHRSNGKLAIAEDIIIFYPWPIHILVSKKHPNLVSRIQYGLTKAQDSGEFDLLFNKHFGHILERIENTNAKVILLKTPNLPQGVPTTPTLIKHPKYLN